MEILNLSHKNGVSRTDSPHVFLMPDKDYFIRTIFITSWNSFPLVVEVACSRYM